MRGVEGPAKYANTSNGCYAPLINNLWLTLYPHLNMGASVLAVVLCGFAFRLLQFYNLKPTNSSSIKVLSISMLSSLSFKQGTTL